MKTCKIFYFFIVVLCIIVKAENSFVIDGLKVSIYSGVEKKSINLHARKAMEWTIDSTCLLTLNTELKNDAQTFKLKFSMPENNDNRLLLTVVASIELDKVNRFFDGFTEHKVKNDDNIVRDSIFQTFPLAAAWHENDGVALGLSPDSTVSYLKCQLKTNSDQNNLIYQTKIVVDNIKTQEIEFCTFPFLAEFAWKDAIENYYKIYSPFFQLDPAIDQRIYGIGGYFVSTHLTRDLEIHAGRHMGLDWEWTYCPWNLAGNWFVEGSEWTENDGYWHWETYWQKQKCSFQDYQTAEKYRFISGNRQAAMFYYILPKDISNDLLAKYPDAHRVNKKGEKSGESPLYSLPDNKNKTTLSFAYGSELAQFLERKLRLAVENYEISGFAFDMTNWSADEYCQAQLKFASGRAFDEQGKVYTSDALLAIPFAKYVKSLQRKDKKMAVMMNHALELQPAQPIFYADAVMFEGNPEAQIENFRTLRMFCGQKPLTVWGALGRGQNSAINWNLAREPDIYAEVIDGLANYLLYNCLRYGVSPMNWTMEYKDREFFTPWLEIIRELKRAGWRIVPALSCDLEENTLWFGRFGDGKETIFTITNPGKEKVKTNISIHRKYLNYENYFPKVSTGQKINCQRKNDLLQFEIELEAKEIMILRDQSWQKKEKPKIVSDWQEILKIYNLPAQQKLEISLLLKNDEFKSIADFIDRFYPYRQACLEKNAKYYTREPGMLNNKYNNLWKLPIEKQLNNKAQIAVGSLQDFPELAALVSEENIKIAKKEGVVIAIKEKNILWFCAENLQKMKILSDYFFESLEHELQ